jgi:hypothetical protein
MSIAVDSHHWRILLDMAIEAHSLQEAMSYGLLSCYHKLVLPKVVQDRF